MDDSFILANFHSICRLCLKRSALMVSIYSNLPDEDGNIPLTSKIADCFELQINPKDGLPTHVCYKCLFEIDKYSQFRYQCLQSDMRLRQIIAKAQDFDSCNSTDVNNYNNLDINKKVKQEYVVDNSVVMVVDPTIDYDSTEDSDNGEQSADRNNTEGETLGPESFFKNVSMCQYCDQAFVSEEKCKIHERQFHDKNLPYSCLECRLVFAERSQHIQHTRHVHGNDKPYHCPECEKSFTRRSDLRKHSIVHTGIRPFQCHYCLKSFSRNTNLSKHLRIHSGRKPNVCPLCPRSFVDKSDLERHVLVHSGMKPYACRKCPLTFGRKDKLIKHEMRHGPISPDKTTDGDENIVINVNPFSNLITPGDLMISESNYDLPRVPDHISGENSFVNQIHRNPVAARKQMLNPPKPKVVPLKNRPKNIKCHQCPKRFSSLDAYKTHVSIAHVGSRVFQCKVCFKKFLRKKELDRHAALHTSGKLLSCSQCDKKFTRKDKLVKHEETHGYVVNNMPCIECGATFDKKDELVAHIKSHFVNDFEVKDEEENVVKGETEPSTAINHNHCDTIQA